VHGLEELKYFQLREVDSIIIPRRSIILDANPHFCNILWWISEENRVILTPSDLIVKRENSRIFEITTRSNWHVYVFRMSLRTLPYAIIISHNESLIETFLDYCEDRKGLEEKLGHILAMEAEGKRESKRKKIMEEVESIISRIIESSQA